MGDLTRPGHIGDMQQAVDTLFQFNEGSIIRQVTNSSFDK